MRLAKKVWSLQVEGARGNTHKAGTSGGVTEGKACSQGWLFLGVKKEYFIQSRSNLLKGILLRSHRCNSSPLTLCCGASSSYLSTRELAGHHPAITFATFHLSSKRQRRVLTTWVRGHGAAKKLGNLLHETCSPFFLLV